MKKEYFIEAALLGFFVISACAFTALLEHPASPLRQSFEDPFLRRVLIGLAMGATAVALIYSPWGRRSGAHMNPAVTWTFYRLGKVGLRDAAFYTAFQTLGGIAAVSLAASFFQSWVADPAVQYVVTRPGTRGAWAAFGAEAAISFLLMTMVLFTSNHPRWKTWTGAAAGTLVALFIALEGPLSGMSMNPARTLASAVPGGLFDALWVYLVAPPLGMLTAAQIFRRVGAPLACAKLMHQLPCLFCEERNSRP